jgi:outer membrane murein-binding lipoprotein Lpp
MTHNENSIRVQRPLSEKSSIETSVSYHYEKYLKMYELLTRCEEKVDKLESQSQALSKKVEELGQQVEARHADLEAISEQLLRVITSMKKTMMVLTSIKAPSVTVGMCTNFLLLSSLEPDIWRNMRYVPSVLRSTCMSRS